jgi:Tol biopolymer transport system component
MTTKSGGGESSRKAGIAVAALVALGMLLTASGATARAEDPARIVYSNGGRILTMKSDGTARAVIFGKNRSPLNDELGASEPDVSPDGNTVVFGFKREARFEDQIDIWRVGSDGKGARRLLVSKRGELYGDPAFAPDGRIVVAFFKAGPRFTRTGLISIAPDGSGRKKIFETRTRKRAFRSVPLVMEPAVSPDGRKVLYLLNEGIGGIEFDEGFENDVMVRDLTSGKTRRIARDGYDASWSPDGKKIVYSVQADGDPEICWWESGCSFRSSIAVMRADGTGRHFLAGRTLDARSPDWSRDGRIVFQSARNVPDVGEANEIYSVRPDGGCLTMLTNGSPASITPAWSDAGEGADTAPAACGASPPDTGVELKLPPRLGETSGYWLGTRAGNRLLTGLTRTKPATLALYLDCSREKRTDCSPPIGTVTLDICLYRGEIAEALAEGRIVRKQRGVPVFRDDGSELGPVVTLFAGRAGMFLFGTSGRGAGLGTREVDQLRRFDEEAASGNLPAVRFPSYDLRLMEKVKAAYRGAGSVAGAAKRLGRGPAFIRRSLRASRKLARFGEYGKVNCPPNGSRTG